MSLRIWDQRLQQQRWHPLFLAGQAWPTPQPLELVLACRSDQPSLEVQLGTPQAASRAEVVFIDGLPTLRQNPAGDARVVPWSGPTVEIPLSGEVQEGRDRLKLRFSINADQQLTMEGEDLATNTPLPPQNLGIVE